MSNSQSYSRQVINLILASLFITFILTSSVQNFSLEMTLEVFLSNFTLTFFSVIVVFIIQIFVLTFFNSNLLTILISVLISLMIAIVNFLKIQFRAEPIIPTDIGFLMDIPSLVRLVEPIYVLLMIILIIVAVVLIIGIKRSEMKSCDENRIFTKTREDRRLRIIIALVCSTFLVSLRTFQNEGSLLRKAITTLGFTEFEFDPLKSYQTNGFVPGYISKITDNVMVMPEGYSQAAVDKIMKQYQEVADSFNEGLLNDSFEDVSVVYVLSESTSDPRRIDGVDIDSNPLNYIQSKDDKFVQGILIPPTYGGNTANTEFEILTGLPVKHFESSAIIPFKTFVPEREHFYNFIDDYKRDNPNSKAISIHSYNDKLFKRPEVYQTFGFDESYFDDTMVHNDHLSNSTYISDASAFQEALLHLNQRGSQFINLVTMQNHSPFTDKYDSQYQGISVPDSPSLEEELSYYTQGIFETDQAVRNFIEVISKMEKKVVVVFYGDHLPGLYNPLLEKNKEPFDLYQTDFFIYKNFDDERESLSIENFSSSSINALTHITANVKINAFHALNLTVNDNAIGGQANFYLTDEGAKLFQDLSVEKQAQIQDQIMIEYDLVAGEGYSLKHLD